MSTLNVIVAMIAVIVPVLAASYHIWQLGADVKQLGADVKQMKGDLLRVSAALDDELSASDDKLSALKLSPDERAVLVALVAESHGIGDGVAVYPFESTVRKLGMEGRSSVVIAALQDHDLVVLGEEMGYDRLEQRESPYPVYQVTPRGFRWMQLNDY